MDITLLGMALSRNVRSILCSRGYSASSKDGQADAQAPYEKVHRQLPHLGDAGKGVHCVKTDRVRPSVRSHGSGKPVYRSLIFAGSATEHAA